MELMLILIATLGVVFLIYKLAFKEVDYGKPGPTDTTPMINKDATVVENVLDVNKDGKVTVEDAVEVVKKTRARAKKTLNQNNDGKITVKDVKVAASKAKAKSAATVAKVRGRKPSSKVS